MGNEFENNYSETTENYEAPALEGYGESQAQTQKNEPVVYQKDNSLAKAALIVGGVAAVGMAAVKLGGKALTWVSEKHLKKKGYILTKPVKEEPEEETEAEVAESVEAEVVSAPTPIDEPTEPVKKRK